MKHERWERLQRESEALQAWARKPVPIPIMYRANDPILHTDEHPFCDDMRCPCHGGSTWEQIDYQIEHLELPFDNGLLTVAEKHRLWEGRQV